jgi:hypothetical protein
VSAGLTRPSRATTRFHDSNNNNNNSRSPAGDQGHQLQLLSRTPAPTSFSCARQLPRDRQPAIRVNNYSFSRARQLPRDHQPVVRINNKSFSRARQLPRDRQPAIRVNINSSNINIKYNINNNEIASRRSGSTTTAATSTTATTPATIGWRRRLAPCERCVLDFAFCSAFPAPLPSRVRPSRFCRAHAPVEGINAFHDSNNNNASIFTFLYTSIFLFFYTNPRTQYTFFLSDIAPTLE